MTRNEEWREFYTQVGFRNGFANGAEALLRAVAPHLSADQHDQLQAWISESLGDWKSDLLTDTDPPPPPEV